MHVCVCVNTPEVCTGSYNRQQGYLFLRSLGGQDEIWVHPSLPNVAGKMRMFAEPEPRRECVDLHVVVQLSAEGTFCDAYMYILTFALCAGATGLTLMRHCMCSC